jgi:hypothetical protein
MDPGMEPKGEKEDEPTIMDHHFARAALDVMAAIKPGETSDGPTPTSSPFDWTPWAHP